MQQQQQRRQQTAPHIRIIISHRAFINCPADGDHALHPECCSNWWDMTRGHEGLHGSLAARDRTTLMHPHPPLPQKDQRSDPHYMHAVIRPTCNNSAKRNFIWLLRQRYFLCRKLNTRI
jgi:hypothetical protein